MRVRMYPHPTELSTDSSGIAQVVINYARCLPRYGIQLVEPHEGTYDIDVAHAAGHPGAMVNHCHGLLWTGEMEYSEAGYAINADIVRSFKLAREITVPSEWVAKTLWRDMRRRPHIIPHGVNFEEWQHRRPNEGYVLWGKNRTSDGLDPSAINDIARAFPSIEFVTTFDARGAPSNVKSFKTAIPHDEMKIILQSAAVLLAPDRETFGIQHLEAMASGVPVLSIDAGAVPTFMTHGVSGYCFQPGNLQDAVDGLSYCLSYRDALGRNGREIAREYTWEAACESVAEVYRLAETEKKPDVAVVIPNYNYGHFLEAAVQSAIDQTYELLTTIVIVDDGSSDNSYEIAMRMAERDNRVKVIRQENAGVAVARNNGFKATNTKYVVFLDADDRIEPNFIKHLVPVLEDNPNLGVAYTGIRVPLEDGTEIVPWDWPYQLFDGEVQSERIWPQEFSFETHMDRSNQVPTCCLIRSDAFRSIAGYRSRYCPLGAGSEDAELFLRLGAMGWGAQYVPSEAHSLYVHNHIEGLHSGRYGQYDEPDWTAWHPWTKDGKHPFASIAQPLNGISHPVYSYDKPMVSVIIPVGPGHEQSVINALDSLEAQTFRGWEAVVVWDCPLPPDRFVKDSYPHVRWEILSPGGYGAGAARNIGVGVSSAPLIAFLDADDYYHADFLKACVTEFINGNAVVYTDYVSVVPKDVGQQPGMKLQKDRGDGTVLVSAKFGNFNEALAMARPEGDRPYVWSGITVLLPRAWHETINGFDANMETWEDCDYLLRLSWYGFPFTRIPQELWIYSFVSGERRKLSEGQEEELMAALQKKYDSIFSEQKA